MKRLLFLIPVFIVCHLALAQNVGIGTSSPGALLDVSATNAGILIPRVALTGTGSAGPLTSPATSTMVYNTATATNVTPGYYYWSGTAWIRLIDNTSIGGATTVSNTSSINTLSTTVNGVTGSTVPIVNSISNTSSANTLSTTVNGVTGTTVPIINSNILSLSGNTLTSTVNGVAPTQSLSGLSLSGDVTGTLAGSSVGRIQGQSVSATAPSAGQVLEYIGSTWTPASPGSSLFTAGTGLGWSGSTLNNTGVTSVATGSGLTGGPITTTGTIGIATGGVSNAMLTNSTISGVALGSNLNTLTIGTGLSGTSYNGSSAVTIANAGVTSAVAGTGIGVSGATGAVTFTNTGVTSIVAGSGVNISGAAGAVTITNSAQPAANTITGSGTTNYHAKFTGTNTIGNSLIYDNGTNVGIGTTAPVMPLQVGNTTNAVGLEPISTGANIGGTGAANAALVGGLYSTNPIPGSAIVFGAQGGAGQRGAIAFATKAADDNTTQPTYQMVVTQTGNVGIGTTNPLGVLQIRQSANVDLMVNTVTAGAITINAINDANTANIPLELRGSQIIVTAGNVGIGVSPGSPLDVNGTITARADAGGTPVYLLGRSGDNYSSILGFNHAGSAYTGRLIFDGGGAVQLFNGSLGQGIYIGSNGFVNVNYNALQGSWNFYVAGTTACSAGAWTASDRRFKKNIEPLAGSLEKINQLRGVSYDWRKDEFPELKFNLKRQVGLIAQELEKVVPEAVLVDDKGYYAVNYSALVPVLIEGMKEQEKKIADMQLENDQLKKDNESLKIDKADAGDVAKLKLQIEELKRLMEVNGIRNEK